jgi:hypothetical protein
MTPKEKAIQLVNKYSIKVEVFFTEDSILRIINASMRLNSAKQCALIAVDEILSFFNNKAFVLTYQEITKYEIPYWQEVKKEIEAL